MATSSHKSTSKKTNPLTHNPNPKQLQSTRRSTVNSTPHKAPPRRSSSVSAFSRNNLDLTSDFLNKRDNPLFWVDDSLREREIGVKFAKFEEISSKLNDKRNLKGDGGGYGEGRRGRSVSRNSRVDTGRRRRSLSRGHYGICESERERESSLPFNTRSKSKIGLNANRSLPEEKNRLVRSTSDLSEIVKGWSTWSSQHPASETSDDFALNEPVSRIPHWDDGRSTSYVSEVEEKTIKPVSEEKISHLKDVNGTTCEIRETVRTEVRRAISDLQYDLKDAMLRRNSDVITNSILSDAAPELENPNALEFMTDIRGEFSRELEECEERTRKLRAELAVEEHRELELNKILHEIVPEIETPAQVQKTRAVRKASAERRKVSKRLEEEAMAYFDECVSISTFDDSDFSSLEDPPSNIIRVGGDNVNIPRVPNVACPFESQGLIIQSPVVQYNENPSLQPNNSRKDSTCTSNLNSSDMKSQFSFTSKPSCTTSLEQDVKNYVKKFSKDSGKLSSNSQIFSAAYRNTEDYSSQVCMEKYLMDRMSFKSRIESGSMLLCGFPLSPFSSALW